MHGAVGACVGVGRGKLAHYKPDQAAEAKTHVTPATYKKKNTKDPKKRHPEKHTPFYSVKNEVTSACTQKPQRNKRPVSGN